MNPNYFFIDGSALTAQIRTLQRSEKSFQGRKLCPRKFIDHFVMRLTHLHRGSYKRATFYFPKGDEVAIEAFISVPDHAVPGEVEDMHFKFCGQKLKKSAEFAKFVDEQVPPQFVDRFQKSEKGVDTEICCDALRLASTGRMERLFLLSNDSDMVPLCRTLKEFGANISILHLSQATLPNIDLLREADTYNIVAQDGLSSMFLPVPESPATDGVPAEEPVVPEAPLDPSSEKASETPEAEHDVSDPSAVPEQHGEEGEDDSGAKAS